MSRAKRSRRQLVVFELFLEARFLWPLLPPAEKTQAAVEFLEHALIEIFGHFQRSHVSFSVVVDFHCGRTQEQGGKL